MQTDIHSHVLPRVDDGARSTEETGRLLSHLSQNGITHLALTPHYYPSQESREHFLEKRERALQQLLALPEAAGFHFTLGAEVYLTETVFNSDDFEPLCYRGTNRMLTEPEYTKTFTDATRRRILRLIYDHGIVPVIAHIDRFPFLYQNRKLLNELKREGCLFQVNLSSFASLSKRAALCRLFREGLVDFLGEDVHREVLGGKERQAILKKLSKREPDLIPFVNHRAKTLIFTECLK